MSSVVCSTPKGAEFRAVARLHAEGISEGFLSTLGEPFLATLYRGIAEGGHSGVVVARRDDEVLGFIAWARDVKACYKSVLRSRGAGLLWTLLPNALKPAIYRKAFETLRYPARHGHDVPADAAPAGALRPEMLSMAVSAAARGSGVGKLLVDAVDEQMVQLGVPGYYVVTHAIDERSNGFYTGRGFRAVRCFTSHGKPMNEYYKSLV